MKKQGQGRGVQFWTVLGVLTVGVLLVAGFGTVDSAWAAQISSGLLRSDNYLHCSVVNLSSAEITVRVAILNGNDGSTCNDNVQTIGPLEARGVVCLTGAGTYCVVTGSFDKGKVRGVFSARDSNDNPFAVLDLR
jgi:hypothetical protein